ncbi:MAG: hypothetical protein PHF93_00135 [Acidobacteriota bacterium]|jgi:hypothetical protein|nr:hypothetical protein [Acidobacteriota bacterium]OQB54824.1 MAG: hypothetical protein BWX98_02214 [Candidatus Aminicenantes bacterium ADurb.Bin147]HNQ80590.1 hypothetical protein [Candidatus Aminicenantes bacterium]MDD8009797.1 hypothetical protein [Acidobacteriota bacterium]MDD8027980.1 hypothetical protein [Acidobacteriota bacterium]
MELFDLLDEGERRIVSIAAVVCAAVFAVLLVFGVRAWLNAGRASARRAAVETEWRAADQARKAAVAEWSRWDGASADVRELRGTWLYDRGRGIQTMRSDLADVLKKAGASVPEITYGESEVVKNRMRRYTVGFHWAGSYPAFRRLLETLEAHPRALFVSKVDFRVIVEGHLEAGVTLEGYAVDE